MRNQAGWSPAEGLEVSKGVALRLPLGSAPTIVPDMHRVTITEIANRQCAATLQALLLNGAT